VNLKVFRIRELAKLPKRAYPTDAGMDLFYCPSDKKKLYDDTNCFYIPPRESRLLPTGIKVEIPFEYMLEIKNKSGIASKQQLLVGACVCDSGYDGEIFINLHNVGYVTQTIEPGEKIAQAVLTPVVRCSIEEVYEDTLNEDSPRGKGAFGSTGRQ